MYVVKLGYVTLILNKSATVNVGRTCIVAYGIEHVKISGFIALTLDLFYPLKLVYLQLLLSWDGTTNLPLIKRRFS